MKTVTSFAFLLSLILFPSNTVAQPSANENIDRVSELEAVKNAIDRFGRMWEDEDMEAFANLIAHDASIIIIGTDSAEQWVGYEAYREARRKQYASYQNVEFNTYDQLVTLSQSGDVAWFSQKFDLFLIAQGTPVSLEGIRLTGVLEKRFGYWRIVQLHNSVPVLGQAAEY